MDEYTGGPCPKCENTMKMVRRKNGLIFICSQKGCKETVRLDKEDLLSLIDMEEYFNFMEIQSEIESGNMDAYPDWDPDKEDLDTYLDWNG